MSYFLSFGESRRMHFAGDILESLKEQMIRQDSRSALGETALKILDVIDMMFIPTIRHGQLETPRRLHGKNAIAFFALKPNETVTLDDMSTLPVQLDRIPDQSHYRWETPTFINNRMTLAENMVGLERTVPIRFGKRRHQPFSRSMVQMSRPFISVRYDRYTDRHERRSTAFHEIFHALQDIEEPFIPESTYYNDKTRAKDELVTYRNEAIYWSQIDSRLRKKALPPELESPNIETIQNESEKAVSIIASAQN